MQGSGNLMRAGRIRSPVTALWLLITLYWRLGVRPKSPKRDRGAQPVPIFHLAAETGARQLSVWLLWNDAPGGGI